MEGENSGSNVNVPNENARGEKIWNMLVRYLYQKISPSQLFAIMIIMNLCANNEEAAEEYIVLDPQNNYELVPTRKTNNPKPTVFGYFLDKLVKAGGFCYNWITAENILTFMKNTGWGAQYIDAVTEIVNPRRTRNQNTRGSADPNPSEDGNAPLLTDPVSEYEIAKEILIYLHGVVPAEDILTLLKTTRWGENYKGYIEAFIQMYQSQSSA